MNAHFGQEEFEHFLKNQSDIPMELRGKVAFVFTAMSRRKNTLPGEFICCVVWNIFNQCWEEEWQHRDADWHGDYKVLRYCLKSRNAPFQRHVPQFTPGLMKDVVDDTEPIQINPAKLRFIDVPREGGNDLVDDEAVRVWAKEIGTNRGLSDVPALVGTDRLGFETIPVEFRDNVLIVLLGTLLRFSDGGLYVPYLDWWVGSWTLHFGLLSDLLGNKDYRKGCRLVSCEQISDPPVSCD